MYRVRNDKDFREICVILHFLTSDSTYGKTHKQRKSIVELKREMRRWAHRETDYDRRIIKDEGIDGYVALERLPADIPDLAEAEAFFEEFMTLHCRPSLYDCTGQAFTNWFKIFERNGSFYAYHSVGFDV